MENRMYFSGESVALRALDEDDVPLVAQWINDERISGVDEARFPVSVAEEEEWYERVRNDDSKRKLVVENHDEQPVGMVSIFDIDHKNMNAEIGVYIAPEHQRRGFAAEALKLLMRFAFEEMNIHKLYCSILGFNEPSLKLFRSLGFREDGVMREHVYTRGRFEDVHRLATFRRDHSW